MTLLLINTKAASCGFLDKDRKMCDHMIGVNISDDGGFLHQSQVDEYSVYAKTRFDAWAGNPNAWSKIVEQKKNWTPKQHLFNEYEMFDYCPLCGQKIGEA